MELSKTIPSHFSKPLSKKAKLVKTELNSLLENIVLNYTRPLRLEIEPHTLETIEQVLSFEKISIRIYNTFRPLHSIHPNRITDLCTEYIPSVRVDCKTISPVNLYTPIQEVFSSFSNKVTEHILPLDQPK